MNRSRITGDLVSQNNIFVDIANDRVGIGSTIPGEKLSLPDSAKIALGNSADLEIYHDGSHSYIHDGGTGNLKLRSNNFRLSNADESKISATFVPSGAAELYYDNSAKFKTKTYGVNVIGTLETDGLVISGVTTSTVGVSGGGSVVKINKSGTSELTSIYNNNAATLAINDSGAGAQIVLRGQSPKLIFDQTAGGNGSIYYDSTDFVIYRGVPVGAPAASEVVRFNSFGLNVTGTTDTDGLVVSGVTTASGMLNANGDLTITTGSPTIHLTENNGDPDYRIFVNGGIFNIDDVTNNTTPFSINTTRITLNGNTLVNSSIFHIHDKIIHWADDDTAIRFPANDTISMETAGTQGVRLTSAQKLLVGDHTVSRSIGNSEHILQTEGTTANENGISIYAFNSNMHAGHFTFGKSRNNSAVADDDFLGHIIWCAHDGTDVNSTGARISAAIDGTPGSNDTPGRLEFYTTSDGEQTPTERLRIDSDGDVIIGTDSWQYKKALNVQGSSGHILSLYNGDTGTYAANTLSGIELKLRTGNTGNQFGSCEIRAFKENGTNGDSARALSFYTGVNGGSPNERLRITSTGVLEIERGSNSGEAIDIKTTATTSATRIRFVESGTSKGELAYSHNNDQLELVGRSGQSIAMFTNGANERLCITSDGKINVGNAISSDPWSRTGNTNTGVRLAQSTTSYAISANSNEIVAIFNRTSGTGNGTILELKYDNVVIASLASNFNSFTQNITIDSNSSASLGLDRANTSSGAVIDFKTNGSVKWYMGLRGLVNDNFYIRNESGSTDALTILTNGRVGVNHTAPTAPLDVKGADSGINIRSDANDRPHLNMINGSTTMLRISCNGSVVDFGDANSPARYMTFDPESDHSIVRMNAQTYVKSPVQRSSVFYHGAGFQYRDDSNNDHPVLHVQATSNGGGVNNIVVPNSKIVINGKSIGGAGRSWKLTVIKGSGSNIGQVIHHQTYDVYGNGTSEATNYVNALSTYTTNNNLIIVTTSDEPSSHAGSIRTALRDTYGAKDSMYNYFRYAYVFAFRHGYGTLGEQNSIYWSALNTRAGGGQDNIKSVAAINFTVCL